MPLKIFSISFKNELDDISYPTLNANIGDKVTATIELEFENTNRCSEDNTVILAPTDTTHSNVANIVWCKNTKFIKELKVGDEVAFTNSTWADPLIYDFVTEILDGNSFRLSEDVNVLFADNGWTYPNKVLYTNNDLMYTITNLLACEFSWNLIPNGFDFSSLIDGQKNVLQTNTATILTTRTLVNKGVQNKVASATILNHGINIGIQTLTLEHTFIVTPLFLATEYSNLLKNIAPKYLKDAKTLNYIANINLGRDLYDRATFRNVQYSAVLCNVGWFNELYNGDINNFYTQDFSIKNLHSGNFNDSLDFNNQNEVKFTIKANDALFDADSKVKVMFWRLPSSDIYYKNNNRSFDENFQFDYCIAQANDTLVTNANLTSTTRKITSVNTELIDSETIEVTAIFQNGSDSKLILNEDTEWRYQIACIVKSSIDEYQRVTLNVNTGTFIEELETINIIDSDIKYIEHPYDSVNYGVDTIEAMPTDDIAINTAFTIDYTDLQADNVKIISVEPQIVLTKTGEADIVLDNYVINAGNVQSIAYDHSVSGKVYIQDFAFSQGKGYKIPNEIRRNIVLARDYENDDIANNIFAFALNYPIMIRWEYWEQLILEQMPSDFFDNTEDFKGYNHNWQRLVSLGWSLKYRNKFTIERKGVFYSQIVDKAISVVGFSANADYSNVRLKSYKVGTSDELTNGTIKFINGYENTKLELTFEKIGGDDLDIENVGVVFFIETKETGGQYDIRRLSSIHDSDSQSWFVENKITVTKTSTRNFKATATLDYSKLPFGYNFTVYPRVYEVVTTLIPDGARITNDNIIRATMDGSIRIVL